MSELDSGIVDFEPKSPVMHSSQSPPSVRPQPEQRNVSKSLFRSTASNQTSASLSPVLLEDVPVSSSNKKLGKASKMYVRLSYKAGYLQQGSVGLLSGCTAQI